MTSLLLCAVILCTPATETAHWEWGRLALEYNLPPLSITWQPMSYWPSLPVGTLAGQGGFDAQGRTLIYFDPEMEHLGSWWVRYLTAHEAFHTIRRLQGIVYDAAVEETEAYAFADAWMRWGYFSRP